MTGELADAPLLQPELLAGALGSVAAACGIEAYRPPVAGLALLEASFNATLVRLAPLYRRALDPAEISAAREVLFQLTLPYVAIAHQLVATIIEWTGGEMTEQRILELVEQHLESELA